MFCVTPFDFQMLKQPYVPDQVGFVSFYRWLNSVCQYLVESVCVYTHVEYFLVTSLSGLPNQFGNIPSYFSF